MTSSSIRFSLIGIVFATSLGLQNAHALPLPPPGQEPDLSIEASFAPDVAVDFTAIVALNNCSGSLVRLTTSLGSDDAMVLTNGHCLEGGFLSPGHAVVNKPSNRTFKLLSSNGNKILGTLQARRILYGTMTNTDMALYGLTESYDAIEKKYSVRPLTIARNRSASDRRIAIASGYWKRIYSCSIDTFINELREANWIWKDSIRYSKPGCETIGGTSGSPIIDAETYEVVGVNNTGNEDGGRCTMNNPCEVDSNGNVTVLPQASYGQQIYWVYDCLDSGNTFDLSRPGCLLTRPKSQ
ncbi:MAG TPA: serine protease [Bdellovibrionota bacterium]|nr:serine protease [Bdellovibrionota bacterium]